MPMDKKRYPPDWGEIAKRIKERAGWKCEGCGLAHGTTIMRSKIDPAHYLVRRDNGCWYTTDGEIVHEPPPEFHHSKASKVRLTTHHKGVMKPDGAPGDRRDKMDCRDENLAALCERCHFLADQDLNIVSRRRTNNQKKRKFQLDAGQKELW